MDLRSELAQFGPGAAPRVVTREEARSYCHRLATSHYENFTVVSRLFPRRLDQHLCNVYAYCRWADDLADESAAPASAGVGSAANAPVRLAPAADLTPTALLAWWEAQLDALYAGETRHPVFVALAETVRTFHLPRQPLADLLVAFRRDQQQTRYATLDDLLTYCEKSADPVGRLVLHLGDSYDDQNVRWSDAICTGLQLANFWQDVRRDHERGRIYLPQDACRRHGWDEARFAAGRCDDDFRRLLAPLVARAEEFLNAGRPLADHVHRDLRLPVRVFRGGGLAVLAAIRRSRYDVWARRPTVGRLAKLRLLLAAWLGT